MLLSIIAFSGLKPYNLFLNYKGNIIWNTCTLEHILISLELMLSLSVNTEEKRNV